MDSVKSQKYTERTKNLNPVLKVVVFLNNYLTYDMFGGTRIFKLSHITRTVSVLTFSYLCITIQNIYTLERLILFIMTVIYSLSWPIKMFIFPDESWENRQTISSSIFFFVYDLIQYIPILFINGVFQVGSYPVETRLWVLFSSMVYFLGLILFLLSDAQKYFVLKLKPGLIDYGMFRFIRHPNYLGQILIFIGFSLMCWNLYVTAWYTQMILFLFIPNILVKENSMSRYPSWKEYCSRAGLLLPKLF